MFDADATTQKGIDDRRETKEVVQQAEHLAAEAWGAASAILDQRDEPQQPRRPPGGGEPGDTVLVARNSPQVDDRRR